MIKISGNTFKILQVGCGGTGGYLVPKIARLIMTLKQFKGDCLYGYTLVDFDLVEELNLYRQNFIKADLQKNKAEVMAKRYSVHFGVDIGYSDVKAKDYTELDPLFPYPEHTGIKILIGCVDNNSARKIMHDLFLVSTEPIVYIDSGNGKLTGQVVVGYKNNQGVVKLQPLGVIFPEALVEEKEKKPHSCALNALENPQNIGANDMAATVLFSVINILLTNKKIESHIITFDGLTANARAVEAKAS